MKQLAFLPGQCEDGHEGEDDDGHREEHRAADKSRRVEDRFPDEASIGGIDTSLLDITKRVLRHDDAGVDEYANGDSYAGEAHDVR